MFGIGRWLGRFKSIFYNNVHNAIRKDSALYERGIRVKYVSIVNKLNSLNAGILWFGEVGMMFGYFLVDETRSFVGVVGELIGHRSGFAEIKFAIVFSCFDHVCFSFDI